MDGALCDYELGEAQSGLNIGKPSYDTLVKNEPHKMQIIHKVISTYSRRKYYCYYQNTKQL